MLRLVDAYTIRARLLPAVLGAAPALAALALLISWNTLGLSTMFASLGALALIYALSDWARNAGKKIEPTLFQEMGGKPSVTIMLRSDGEIDGASKDRYRTFLAGKIQRPEPSGREEEQNPIAVQAFYELAGTWLREHTRDTKKFSILFSELVTYGFRRNLLGMRWPALALNAVVVAVCGGMLVWCWPFKPDDASTVRIIVVLGVAVAHAVYFLLVVSRDNVKAAAKTYARQLIISCEAFISGGSTAKKAKAKASP